MVTMADERQAEREAVAPDLQVTPHQFAESRRVPIGRDEAQAQQRLARRIPEQRLQGGVEQQAAGDAGQAE